MKALIAGAGIEGLATALFLHEAGVEVEVFERAESVCELGVGINMLPHAVRELAIKHAQKLGFRTLVLTGALANQISLCLSDSMTENDIFRALADPTRRTIFEKLAAGRMNASKLRDGIAISQPAMSQHLSVLRSAGLVREERQGRFVNYEVDPEGLARIGRWLARYRAWWPDRVEDLKTLLKDMDQ